MGVNLALCFHLDDATQAEEFLKKNLEALNQIEYHLSSNNCCLLAQAEKVACFYLASNIRFSKEFSLYFTNCANEIFDEIRYFDYAISNVNNVVLLPEWSEIRFWALDYLGPVIQIPSNYAHATNEFDRNDINELILSQILRVRLIKLISGTLIGEIPKSFATRPSSSLQQIFDASGIEYKHTEIENVLSLRFASLAPQKISIVIPTAGKLNLDKSFVQECVESIVNQDLKDIQVELIVVYDTKNNIDFLDSVQALATAFIEVKFIPYPHDFNFSEKCNIGADASSGDVLIFLNDDVQLKSENALLEISGAAMFDTVGAVGAKLKFSDGSIQHAGIVLVDKSFGHAYYSQKDVPGLAGDLLVSYEVLGVTGACLAIRRPLFYSLGKWNLELPSSYNDVEISLRIRNSGFSNLILSHLEIEHFGSATRKSVTTSIDRRITENAMLGLEVEPYLRHAVKKLKISLISKISRKLSILLNRN